MPGIISSYASYALTIFKSKAIYVGNDEEILSSMLSNVAYLIGEEKTKEMVNRIFERWKETEEDETEIDNNDPWSLEK